MKALFSALFTASSLLSVGSIHPSPETARNGSFPHYGGRGGDTLCLYRNSYRVGEEELHCRVYVERNRKSEEYRRILAGAAFDEEDRRDLAYWLEVRRRNTPEPLARHDRRGCPEVWLPLVRVSGTYYLDGGVYNYPCRITDSLVVRQMMDGPWPQVIETFEEPERGHYRIFTSAIGSGEREQLDIYLLKSNGVRLALFVRKQEKASSAELFVPSEEALRFDLLVWDFPEMPMGDEVTYDEIDYRKLIENAKYESE